MQEGFGGNKSLDDNEICRRFNFDSAKYHHLWKKAIDHEVKVDILNDKIDNLPLFKVPDGYTSKTYLEKLAREGLAKKYDLENNALKDKIIKKLNKELEVIFKMEFENYFLIVQDYVNYAKTNGIYVGPGVGSAVGSIVNYALGITNVDPIKHNLIFEKFINTKRPHMPEIDIEVELDGREKIISYLREKYGSKNVMRIKGERGWEEVDSWGLVIIPDDKLQYIPTLTATKHSYNNEPNVVEEISAYDSDQLEAINYTKFNIRTSYSLERIKKSIIDNTGKGDINNASYSDSRVYEKISNGYIVDLFDIYSKSDVKKFVKELKPKRFEDLALAYAIYTPLPKGNMEKLLRNKNDRNMVSKINPIFDEILTETYGMIVYHEQIMEIFHKLAGYEYEDADIARRNLCKKIELQEERELFLYGDKYLNIKGAISNGISSEAGNLIFDKMLESAAYSFNKAHAVAYAKIWYQEAYLNLNY